VAHGDQCGGWRRSHRWALHIAFDLIILNLCPPKGAGIRVIKERRSGDAGVGGVAAAQGTVDPVADSSLAAGQVEKLRRDEFPILKADCAASRFRADLADGRETFRMLRRNGRCTVCTPH
jgi:hypothetical protein